MTDGNPILSDDSRRSFIKKSALTTGVLALGATGSAAAQQDGGGETETQTETPPDDNGGGGGGGEGIIQVGQFYPNARFTIVSGVIDWVPNVPEVRDDVFDSYNTYQIRWLNTNEIVPFYVGQDSNVGEFDDDLGFIADDDDTNQPQLYEMDEDWELFDEGNNLVEVTFSTVPEEEEDSILANDDWWQDDDIGTGTATPTETPSN